MIRDLKISIITVTYNSQEYLEQTILSVLSQDYSNIEYIIIDGASTDKTISIINKYITRVAHFISEPDENMYDAINKGIKASTGDYVAILNSDDYYVNDEVITNVVSNISSSGKNTTGVYGNLIKVGHLNKKIRSRRCFQVSFKQLLLSRQLTFVGHGTIFMSRTCINKIGLYDSDKFKYAADYDYILRCFKQFPLKYINEDVFCFREHSESITSSGKISKETLSVLDSNGYYEYSQVTQLLVYYYVWAKFILLNLGNLFNRL